MRTGYECPQCRGEQTIVIDGTTVKKCPTCKGLGIVSAEYHARSLVALDEYILELSRARNTLQQRINPDEQDGDE